MEELIAMIVKGVLGASAILTFVAAFVLGAIISSV